MRLWPSSRAAMPKQFLDFFGTNRTLLQSTYDRFSAMLPSDHIYICTCAEYLSIVKEQLPMVADDHVLVEPINRNTAPSVAWAGRRIRKCYGPEANIVITPSDHHVVNEEVFRRNVLAGLEFVSRHDIVLTVGVKPTRPEPGYGYIQMGEPSELPNVYHVKSFTEKPEREFARLFMESGEFLWNTSIYLCNVRYLREIYLHLFTDLTHRIDHISDSDSMEEELAYIQRYYPSYPNMSIESALLERSKDICVMNCDFGWADLGTWHSIYECLGHGEGDNVVIDSEVLMEDCHNNIVKMPKGHLAVINGLDGYIVVESGDVLLICPKGDSSALIRKYVNEALLKYGSQFV